MAFLGFFSKKDKEVLDSGLSRTKTSIFDKISRTISGKSKVDDEILDGIEEALISSDVGVNTTLKIIERLENRVARDKYVSIDELYSVLYQEITELLAGYDAEGKLSFENLPSKPYIILVVGVNGVGKTTTIGKLANKFKKAGKKVYLGAADTFRAAAIEPVCRCGQRVG